MGLEGAQRAPVAAAQQGEFIMPPWLLSTPVQSGYALSTDGCTYVRPTTLPGLLGAVVKFAERAVLVAGCSSSQGTAWGGSPAYISVLHVPELRAIETSANGFVALGTCSTACTVAPQRVLQAAP